MDHDHDQHLDMGEYFDFSGASMPEFHELPLVSGTGTPVHRVCPSHPDSDNCLCLIENLNLGENLEGINHKGDFNNFSSWIPRYSKPEHACDYCKSRKLECFITFEGQTSCSSCNALFRPCSFTQPQGKAKKGAMDTLHIVPEDIPQELGKTTGQILLKSYGHVKDVEEEMQKDTSDSGKKTGVRFGRASVKIMKDWIEAHADHPYPTEEEKQELMNRTGLKASQVSNWLANARRRGKIRQKRAASPSLRPSTQPIDIPRGQNWEDLNPLERWKHSPPENEPASVTDIANAVNAFDGRDDSLSSESISGRNSHQHDSSAGSSCGFSLFKAPSTTSLETNGLSNMSGPSALSSGSNSFNSVYSYGSRNSFGSRNSSNSFGSKVAKKDRRRRRRQPPKTPAMREAEETSRPFQCTFCTDTFKSKYDWTRHEKTLHISLEKWICAPLGPVITCNSSGQKQCVYCDAQDPDEEHLETHNHSACEEKGRDERTFYRKDHLRQHLRLMHGCKLKPSMETWKSEVMYIKSRCGFCGQYFTSWGERADHLSKHFRAGAKMNDWKGCRGFDEGIASKVTFAMPPYLIGMESKSPFPFSASNRASMAHHFLPGDLEELAMNPAGAQSREIPSVRENLIGMPEDVTTPMEGVATGAAAAGAASNLAGLDHDLDPLLACRLGAPLRDEDFYTGVRDRPMRSTCWEILTLRLGRFVRSRLEAGLPVTDEMLQTEARLLLYDDPDPWNQTAADNPEWLALFKQAHGLEHVSPQFDLVDTLEDLGVLGNIRGDFTTGLGSDAAQLTEQQRQKQTQSQQQQYHGVEPRMDNQMGHQLQHLGAEPQMENQVGHQELWSTADSIDPIMAMDLTTSAAVPGPEPAWGPIVEMDCPNAT
ncbi:hypothetical protein BDY21DRAFT_341231 [Lineolata rhizophorae]|uniref:Homeobox and C2H2 transcription factor n=1 Tax=Lineolata rhizophorae TaxID=578093 RepID=A0A6A6P4T3_9PEZI|nr:hypothetical protein BDY21DRAFT_341231 [Lineolata rhizophorae]